MATAQTSHRQSNRFCPPAQRRPFHHRAQGMGLTHGGEMFAEGGWSAIKIRLEARGWSCLLYTSPSPRDQRGARMPSSA